MRSLVAIASVLALAACGGERPANVYPQSAQARFGASCPAESAACRCIWDRITRDLTHEEYEAVLTRFTETGLMDPRVTRARTRCLERNRE